MPSVSYVCPMFLFYNSIIVVMYAFVNGIVYLYKRLYNVYVYGFGRLSNNRWRFAISLLIKYGKRYVLSSCSIQWGIHAHEFSSEDSHGCSEEKFLSEEDIFRYIYAIHPYCCSQMCVWVRVLACERDREHIQYVYDSFIAHTNTHTRMQIRHTLAQTFECVWHSISQENLSSRVKILLVPVSMRFKGNLLTMKVNLLGR